MTSKAKLEANRANARRSTGPRTVAGKARASTNALRHGLNTPIAADPAQRAMIEAWALRFSPGPSIPTEPARAAAIAQAELNRVRAAKAAALRLAAEAVEAASAGEPASKATLTARALIASLPDLLKLDAYERKARSKRDKAFRRSSGLAGEPRIWRNEANSDLPPKGAGYRIWRPPTPVDSDWDRARPRAHRARRAPSKPQRPLR